MNFRHGVAIWRLIPLVLCMLAGLVTGPAEAAWPSDTLIQVEDRIVSSKALMTIDVGYYRRVVQVDPQGRNMHIQFEIRVDVSAIVMSYHRHTLVDAWYDRQGLVAFVTEIDEDGRITQLNGRREKQVGEKLVLHMEGTVDNAPVDKSIPFPMIHFTSLENYPFTAALSRQRQTWRVLNLFNGEVELVQLTPEGVENCPDPVPCSCYRVKVWSVSREGMFYYTGDGLMSYARGEDKLGNFILRTPPPQKPKESGGGLFGGFFGTGTKPAQEPGGPIICPDAVATHPNGVTGPPSAPVRDEPAQAPEGEPQQEKPQDGDTMSNRSESTPEAMQDKQDTPDTQGQEP
jgi:hypothetical protein